MSKVKEAYNQWADSYDEVENKTRDLDKIAITTILSDIKLNDVLELGCGTGKNTLWLSENAKTVTAVDFSEEMINKAKEKINAVNVQFLQADISKSLQFNQKFDVVTCNLILEHIQVLENVFSNVYQSLKQGGYLFISELHPFKQYTGSKARFEKEGETIILECFTHHASEYFTTAINRGFTCKIFKEWFDSDDEKGLPRLISFLFQKI